MTKTKVLISFAVTAKLICVFVFASAKCRFSHDAAHICWVKWDKTFFSTLPRQIFTISKINFGSSGVAFKCLFVCCMFSNASALIGH